ncbi:MAG: hypothetical protein WCT03_03265 [Candidatus Obscuribacterales bacterium]|jgi:hypothetical protein
MIEKPLPRLLLKVKGVQDVLGKGVQVVSDITDLDVGYCGGDLVELRKPDGSAFQSVSSLVRYSLDPLLAVSNPEYSPPVSLWFGDLSKADIPIGTEIWMLVDHPVALKGRRFEYIGTPEEQP